MELKKIIEELAQLDPEIIVRKGFGLPHSYRGFYDELAFEPEENTTVGAMLGHARSALNKTFEGYKGGKYKMEGWTDTWIAEYGSEGEAIGQSLLWYMINYPSTNEKENE